MSNENKPMNNEKGLNIFKVKIKINEFTELCVPNIIELNYVKNNNIIIVEDFNETYYQLPNIGTKINKELCEIIEVFASQTPKEEPKPLTEDSCDLCKGMGAKYVGVPLGYIKCPKCGKY